MTDIEHAKTLFQTGEYSCVLVKDTSILTSTLGGISPMVEFISEGIDLNGYSAADKLVGKAAALLFALAGVKEVFASVMSNQAEEVFLKHGVKCFCETHTAAIINRAGTDLCPMEKAVKDIEEPHKAFDAIKRTLDILRTRNTEDAK